jgi:hypothetical protein
MTHPPLTDQQLDELETLAKSIPAGPWTVDDSRAELRGSHGNLLADLWDYRLGAYFAAVHAATQPLLDEVRRLRAEPSAIEQVEQVFVSELNDDRALTLLDALIVLRSKLPCTCARSQGLHEKSCRRYVPGHELLSPVRRLARAREELGTATVGQAEACGKCKRPFNPADPRWDGAARYAETPYCRRCIDGCQEADAFHACVICR